MSDPSTSILTANRMALFFDLLLAIVAAWLFLLLIAAAATQPLLFDGAMNLEVARSLSEGKGPRRLYDFGTLFAPEVQTKEPYIFVGALVFKLFGVGHFQAHLPNLVYLAALCGVVLVGIRRATGTTASLLVIVLILSLPFMYQYGLNGYGEIPTFTFGLAALLAISSRRLVGNGLSRRCCIAGILAGLAIATKFVGVILAGAVGLVILVRIATESRERLRNAFYGVCAFVGGMMIPLLFVEAWRLAWLGFDAYGEWWNYQLSQIVYQAGASAATSGESSDFASKVTTHFRILASELKRSTSATAMVLVAPVVAALVMLRSPASAERWIVAGLLTVAVAYLLWWLAITPTEKAWLRRIYIGLTCLAAISGVAVANSLRALRKKEPTIRSFAHAAAVVVIFATYFPFLKTAVGTPLSFERQPAVDRVLEASRLVSKLDADAMVFGYGWYSAPNVALFSGRGFVDLTDWPIGLLQDKEAYLVADRATFVVGMLDRVLERYPHREMLPINQVAQVYAIDFANPADPFTNADISQIMPFVTFSLDDYPLTTGMEPFNTIGGRFIESDSEILLAYKGQPMFNVIAYMDHSEPSHYLWPGSLDGRVVIGECDPLHFRFDQPGWRDFNLPLGDCKPEPGKPVRVRILLDNVFDWSTLKHIQQALLLSSIGFVDEEPHRQ